MSVAKHWTEDLDELEGTVRSLERGRSGDDSIDKANLRHYFQRPEAGADESPTSSRIRAAYRRNGENLTREVVDAGMSMLCRPVQVKITPHGADPDVQSSCEDLQELSDAIDSADNWASTEQRVWLDGATCRAGFVKIVADADTCEVRQVRLQPMQCYWDDSECEDGNEPLSFYYVDSVPRRRLMAMFPQHREIIKDLPKFENPRVVGVDPPKVGKSDNVKVIESWSRALGRKGQAGYQPGKHVMKAGKAVLVNETNDFAHLPIAAFRFSWTRKGWAGIPLAQIIAIYDLENKDLRRSKMKAIKAAVPIIWKKSTENTFEGITDLEFQVQDYDDDEPPKVEVPQVLSKELLQTEADNRIRAFAETGINPEVAQGNRPGPNLNSEPAIKAAVDTAQIRLVNIQERWGEFQRDRARAKLMVILHTYQHPENRQKAPGTEKLDEINWGALADLNESKYTIQAKLASGLSLTWAGRLSDMESVKRVAPNSVTEGMALRAIGLNDFETDVERLNSPQRLAEKIINDALKKGVCRTPPTNVKLLEALTKTGRMDHFRALSGEIKCHPNHIEALRKVLEKAEEILSAIQQPPTPAVPAAGAQPVAA